MASVKEELEEQKRSRLLPVHNVFIYTLQGTTIHWTLKERRQFFFEKKKFDLDGNDGSERHWYDKEKVPS